MDFKIGDKLKVKIKSTGILDGLVTEGTIVEKITNSIFIIEVPPSNNKIVINIRTDIVEKIKKSGGKND